MKFFMKPAIVHMSFSVAACSAVIAGSHSCTAGNFSQQKDESRKIEFGPQEHLFVKI